MLSTCLVNGDLFCSEFQKWYFGRSECTNDIKAHGLILTYVFEKYESVSLFPFISQHIFSFFQVRSANAPEETAKFLGHGLCDSHSKGSTLTSSTNESRWFSVGICKYKPGYKSHDLL